MIWSRIKQNKKTPINPSSDRPDNILRPSISDTIEHSSIENLSEYTELLYEDETSKIQASKHILNLARNPENLETLLHSQTLLGALSRVLRDDWKKSTDSGQFNKAGMSDNLFESRLLPRFNIDIIKTTKIMFCEPI